MLALAGACFFGALSQGPASFWSHDIPEGLQTIDVLLWHCEQGEEMTRKAGKPQSWKELLDAARADDISALPNALRDDPDFALMFALAYPHRASLALIKALDTWFG